MQRLLRDEGLSVVEPLEKSILKRNYREKNFSIQCEVWRKEDKIGWERRVSDPNDPRSGIAVELFTFYA